MGQVAIAVFRVAVLFHSPKELQHITAARVVCNHVIIVAKLAHFRAAACRWIPAVLVVQDHGLPHEGFEFRDGMDAVNYVVVIVTVIIAVVSCQAIGEIFGVGKDLLDGRFYTAKFSARALLVAKYVQQDAEGFVFDLFIPHCRQAEIAGLDGSGQPSGVARLVYGEKNIVAVARQIAPAGWPLFVHGQNVTLSPEEIQSQVAADFVALLILASLNAGDDFRFPGSFFSKVTADDRIKLVERSEDGKIQLRKKVAGKYHASIAINDKRFEYHKTIPSEPQPAAIRTPPESG